MHLSKTNLLHRVILLGVLGGCIVAAAILTGMHGHPVVTRQATDASPVVVESTVEKKRVDYRESPAYIAAERLEALLVARPARKLAKSIRNRGASPQDKE